MHACSYNVRRSNEDEVQERSVIRRQQRALRDYCDITNLRVDTYDAAELSLDPITSESVASTLNPPFAQIPAEDLADPGLGTPEVEEGGDTGVFVPPGLGKDPYTGDNGKGGSNTLPGNGEGQAGGTGGTVPGGSTSGGTNSGSSGTGNTNTNSAGTSGSSSGTSNSGTTSAGTTTVKTSAASSVSGSLHSTVVVAGLLLVLSMMI